MITLSTNHDNRVIVMCIAGRKLFCWDRVLRTQTSKTDRTNSKMETWFLSPTVAREKITRVRAKSEWEKRVEDPSSRSLWAHIWCRLTEGYLGVRKLLASESCKLLWDRKVFPIKHKNHQVVDYPLRNPGILQLLPSVSPFRGKGL